MKKKYTSPEILRGWGEECFSDVICVSDSTDADIFEYQKGIENGGNEI